MKNPVDVREEDEDALFCCCCCCCCCCVCDDDGGCDVGLVGRGWNCSDDDGDGRRSLMDDDCFGSG